MVGEGNFCYFVNMKVLKFLWFLPRNILCFFIRGYQKSFSLDHGPMKDKFPFGFCKFTPTCSQYGYEIVKKRGVIVGGLMALKRVLSCNPCSKGGYDPVE